LILGLLVFAHFLILQFVFLFIDKAASNFWKNRNCKSASSFSEGLYFILINV